jgi:signal transduction histidine kinase
MLDKYGLLLENLPYGFAYNQLITDSKGIPVDYIVLDVNSAFAEMTGMVKDEVVGKKITEVLPGIKEDSFNWICTYGKVALTGKSIVFEQYSEFLKRWYEITAYSDEPGYFAVVFRDTTENKLIMETWQRSERWFREVLKKSPIILAHIDLDLRYTWIYNPTPDFDPASLLGKRDDEISENEGTLQLVELKRKVIETGSAACKQITFPLSGGNQTFDISAQPLKDDSGRVIGATTIALNITERIQAEKDHKQLLVTLKNEQARANTILSTVPVGVSISTNLSCVEIVHNPEASKFLRIPSWQSFSHSENPQPSIQLFCEGNLLTPEEMPIQRAAWKGESSTNMEIEFVWEDGIKKTGLYNYCPLRDENGNIIAGLATSQDITEIRLVQNELAKQKQTLEERVREKTETLLRLEQELTRFDRLDIIGEIAASIGHEVRNPITTVKGFLQYLMKKNDITKYEYTFSLMIEELNRAATIITEFLSFSKSGTADLRHCCLNSIVESLLPLVDAHCLLSDQTVMVDLSPIPLIQLNEKEIRQLIINLSRNSIEAMSRGGLLTIGTYVDGDEVVLKIEDQGSGIPPEFRESIGRAFFTTKDNGTGLGLTVCFSIVRRHNAKIDFTSSEEGTVFYIRFKQNLSG